VGLQSGKFDAAGFFATIATVKTLSFMRFPWIFAKFNEMR